MPKETLAALAFVIAAAATWAIVVGELDARFALLELLAAALLALLGVVAALLARRRALFECRSSATFAGAAIGLALASGWTFVAPRGAHDPRQQPTRLEHALYVVDEVRGEVLLVSDDDGDGIADLVAVRGPRTNGPARIDLLSGASGALLRTLWTPPGSREGLGYQMARLDDVSGDGWPDIAVTSGDKLFVFRGPGRDPTLPRALTRIHWPAAFAGGFWTGALSPRRCNSAIVRPEGEGEGDDGEARRTHATRLPRQAGRAGVARRRR